MNRRDVARAGGLLAGLALVGTGMTSTASACSDDDLKVAIEEFRQAMVDGNGARLLELMSDDCTFGHANGVIQTKIEFVKTVVERTEVFKTLRLSDHVIKVSGDMAWARHVFDSDLTFQGQDMHLTLNIIMVWRNEDGRWRLLARQSFKPITV